MIEAVKLNPEQIARRDAATAMWVRTLVAQARDESDPEIRDNARLVLSNRGLGWEVV